MTSTNQHTNQCRLCASVTEKRFDLRVLGKYDVDYRSCPNCLSLQTSEPFWLAETYSGDLPNLDVGAARRALRNCAVIMCVSQVMNLPADGRMLDFGGGDGFVSRLLRDIGYDASVYDKYANNFYAAGFSADLDGKYDLVSAFEVWEHLPEPAREIDAIFGLKPSLVVVSTELYRQQDSNWPYLGPGQGGHVFFYSSQAMKLIAARYGYDVTCVGSTVVFSRAKIRNWQRLLLKIGLTPIGLMVERIRLQTIKPRR